MFIRSDSHNKCSEFDTLSDIVWVKEGLGGLTVCFVQWYKCQILVDISTRLLVRSEALHYLQER